MVEYDLVAVGNGFGMCKATFASNDAPKYVFPSIHGWSRQ